MIVVQYRHYEVESLTSKPVSINKLPTDFLYLSLYCNKNIKIKYKLAIKARLVYATCSAEFRLND